MINTIELSNSELQFINGGSGTSEGLATVAGAGAADVAAASYTAFTAGLAGAEVGAYGGPAGIMIGAAIGWGIYEIFG